MDAPSTGSPRNHPHVFSHSAREWRFLAFLTSPKGELWSSTLAGVLLAVGFVLVQSKQEGVGQALYWVSLGIGMVHGCRAAWASIREAKFDIDVLMVVGAAFAAGTGNPREGALLLFLFVLSGALEDLAMQRTTRAVEALHKLMPTKALRRVGEGEAESWEEVAPEALSPDDIVKVPPGELIACDGVVADGVTSVDQANLTGESMPRTVKPGDKVFAGTVNVGNPMRVRVTKRASESSLQRVLNLVLEAQQQREPVQRLLDRISQPYAIGVMVTSTAVFLIWWLALGAQWDSALFTAITLLIVMSPCAVIIATPTATLAAIARGARAGVLFKGGQAIERLSRLRAVAFDKTGTLTVGKPRVYELQPVGWSDQETLLAVAAGLEQDSTHPIATAVREAAVARGVSPSPTDRPTFTVGRGVSAHVDGHEARLGNIAHTEELIPVCLRARVREVLNGVQSRGRIGTVVVHNEQAGVIILADTVRPGADMLVEQLHALGVRPLVMLTGDNTATARAVAEALRLDRFQAEMLPQDKVEAVKALKAEVHQRDPKGGAGVIGDGVNDAPALAAADVSIAIGSIGSDAALESADIVLLADDLRVVPWAVGLARRTRRTIAFNLVFALSAIVVMAVATLVGSRIGRPLPLWLGVLGHEGGTLLVVANSLWLLAFRGVRGVEPPRTEETEPVRADTPDTPAMAA